MDKIILFGHLALLCLNPSTGVATDCKRQLGVENKTIIKDDQLFSPPAAHPTSYGPEHVRLNGNNGWCSITVVDGPYYKKDVFIEIKLGKLFQISGVLLQRHKNLPNYSYGKKFKIMYQTDGNTFKNYLQKDGSVDVKTQGNGSGIETVMFDSTFNAKAIRWFPVVDENNKCLRMEILGCAPSQPVTTPSPMTVETTALPPFPETTKKIATTGAVPMSPKQRDGDETNIAAIVGGCFAGIVLLILVILFIMRGKILKRKRSKRTRSIKKDDVKLLASMTDNPTYDKSTPGRNYPDVYVSDGLLENDAVYAEPDKEFIENRENPIDYSEIEVLEKSPAKSELGATYVEPDVASSPESDIEFNPIYESTYESPYTAVSGSSIYADPDQLPGRRSFEIKEIPRSRIKFLEVIGSGQFGEVIIGEVNNLQQIIGTDIIHSGSDPVVVAIKSLTAGVEQSVEKEFMKEVRVMASLNHENVVSLLGICKDEPRCMIVEYMKYGDLNQFLKDSRPYDGPENPRTSQLPGDVVVNDTLMYMALQVAAGMNYLSSHKFVHRDLAARNCLVGPAYTVKISDFGMSRYLYSQQYYRIEGKAILPIRWMAPESLFYGKFTSFTDVWAFGVTIWEIFSYARETPYSNMTDQQVIDNAGSCFKVGRKLFQYLQQPKHCPCDIYNVMTHCWAKSPENRPTFRDLYAHFNTLVDSQEASI